MNIDGIIIAVITGLLIWIGHIWVVKLFQWSGTKLWFIPLVIGIILLGISLFTENFIVSSASAIGAVTFFWGIKELFEYRNKNVRKQ